MARARSIYKALWAVVVLFVVVVLQHAYWLNTLAVDLPSDHINDTVVTVPVATRSDNNNNKDDAATWNSTDVIRTLCGSTKYVADVVPPWSYFQKRFTRMRNEFQEAVDSLRAALLTHDPAADLSPICNKKIDVFVGHVLTMGMTGADGGPQGDIMQWSDVIQALQFLGANVTVHRDYKQAKSVSAATDQLWLDYFSAARVPMPHKCRVRFIDAFGTETAFNTHGKAPFCCKKLPSMRQYLTFVPERAPENSFLGFAVPNENRFVRGASAVSAFNRSAVHGLVWGKHKGYVEGKLHYLEQLSTVMTVHVTMQDLTLTDSRIINHGFLSTEQYNALLDQTLFFIGLDQPLFGHGAIEATMKGLIYLNPLFDPPWNSTTHAVLRGKPTHQPWSSQHPFMETLRVPWVLNVNATDMPAVLGAIDAVVDSVASDAAFYRLIKQGYIPPEYTTKAFMQRVYETAIVADYCT